MKNSGSCFGKTIISDSLKIDYYKTFVKFVTVRTADCSDCDGNGKQMTSWGIFEVIFTFSHAMWLWYWIVMCNFDGCFIWIFTLLLPNLETAFHTALAMGKRKRLTVLDGEYDLSDAKKASLNDEKRLIVILENAQLETVKVIFFFNTFILMRIRSGQALQLFTDITRIL